MESIRERFFMLILVIALALGIFSQVPKISAALNSVLMRSVEVAPK